MQALKRCLNIVPQQVALADLRSIYFEDVSIGLAESAWSEIGKGKAAIRDILARGDAIYGINTGFGFLAETRIADDQLAQLQLNLVLSHSAGVGNLIDDRVVRLILFLKIVSLSRGYSGVRGEVVQCLIDLFNKGVTPCVPSKGSVGASGDLAPLAHLVCSLIGVGNVRYRGVIQPAGQVLKKCGITALKLEPKEGLALLNGTQVSTAMALAGLFNAENVFAAAVVGGALSVDAMKGSRTPFDPRIHQARGQFGQIAVAEKYASLLRGSDIPFSDVGATRVQDPYSLRCQPQVMGACLDLMLNAGRVLETEANAVTDNPLIMADTLEIVSGGNFHAEPVAFAADTLALAIAEIASIAERRIALIIDPNMNGGLPTFLVDNGGLNSGFMIAHVTAAALVSENKTLAHPASIDSIPTSANQEDHVSMATFASRRLKDMTENAANVLAIELLAATQAIEFHQPAKTSRALRQVVIAVRSRIPHYDKDRVFGPEIASIAHMISEGHLYSAISNILPSGFSSNGHL